ncbi:glycosyltransferase, partial [Leptolyngbya sp. FACHB-36]|uniref:glycosyltransferase family 2 protein n=1 Tax=Leptolyngbya sp. FACHB-36 TaxID=2692808 RepID=UPI0016807788|nr:glycosyltransferase [Leptolyngbya sp. FACHB-36]
MNLAIALLNAGLVLVALVLLIPISVLFLECLAALLPARRSLKFTSSLPRTAILVPAHNEASGIAATLESLLPQLTHNDQLIVIADNCTDATATVARQAGATVIERHDLEHRGKGYALDFGLRHLTANPPEVVVIVDADCTVAPGAIEQISYLAVRQSRPVQATYLLAQPANPSPKDAVSVLAFTVKNLVRPIGLHQLGLPCLLTGTGMALPWSVVQRLSLASGNLVEDMQLALDLAIVGHPAAFCASARVTGALPGQNHAAKSQRTRW